jgi:hypothetical protein
MKMKEKTNYNAAEFANEVEKFAKHTLLHKAELIVVYDEAVNSNQLGLFRELCFTAKYLMGIMRVLKQEGKVAQVDNLEHVKKDFSENIKKVEEQIRKIMLNADQDQKNYFEEEFFVKSHSGLYKLNELLSDLESAKLYLNHLKRES